MDSDGRDTSQGREPPPSNVVRLPRDWLGPRDELVPFGRPPESPAAKVIELSAAPDPDVYAQDAFWGGDLEAIPRPVIGPRPEAPIRPPEVVAPTPEAPAPPPTPEPPAGVAPLRAAKRRAGPTIAARVMTVGRLRAAAALIAVAAAVAGGAAALPGPGTTTHHVSLRASAPAHDAVPDLPPQPLPHGAHVTRPRVVAATHPARHVTHAAKLHHTTAAPASTATFVKAYTAPAASNSYRSSQPPTARAPVATTQAPVTTTRVPTSTTTAAPAAAVTRKPAAGPVNGPGTPFGPGRLG